MIEMFWITMFMGLLTLFTGFHLALRGGRFEKPSTVVMVIGGMVATISALGFMISLLLWTVHAWLR
jgi:preprotein translocase subunit SecF